MRKPRTTQHQIKTSVGGGSFRDPAGFVYKSKTGRLLRQINAEGFDDYKKLRDSSLYKTLVSENLLVPHIEVPIDSAYSSGAKAVIAPRVVPFISYPFEWSFDQLKDAALLTLKVQKLALDKQMVLKDASAYNVQFIGYKPIFIDTLSFEKYIQDTPWQAYGQFCRHFLAPLVLMSKKDLRLVHLLSVNIDGIPLDLAIRLLPKTSRLHVGQFIHIFAHSRSQKSKADSHKSVPRKLNKRNQLALIDSLERTIKGLKFPKVKTEWGDYYSNTNYVSSATNSKKTLLVQLSKNINPKRVLDLGGNDGTYSRVFSRQGVDTICADVDPIAVEKNYLNCKKNDDKNLTPLLINLTNPHGALGWANEEREPITERLKCDLVLALALIHHLAISNNLPFDLIANYFSRFAPFLIIEFVPKNDSQVKKLLATRKDIFDQYTQENFEKVFSSYYRLVEKRIIADTKRSLYLFSR